MKRDAHYNDVMAPAQHPPDDGTELWRQIDTSLSDALGEPFFTQQRESVSGGCISTTLRIDGPDFPVFLKLGQASDEPMFDAEADALQAIAATNTVRVPAVIARGTACGRAWLAIEFIETGRPAPDAAAHLGEQLAGLHSATGSQFGWHRDNWIGATPQRNTPEQDWPQFFAEHRLRAQLELAAGNGLSQSVVDRGYRLAAALPAIFADYAPSPSLRHGDLWGDNWACDLSGQPFIFDPASYYGDRDADLAMTELFGGFPDSFYRAYDTVLPRAPGYPLRRELYNLYHVLNHFNLFGGGYVAQAGTMIKRLLAEVGA